MWAISNGWAWIFLFGPDVQEGPFDLEGPSTFVIPSFMYRAPHHQILGGHLVLSSSPEKAHYKI